MLNTILHFCQKRTYNVGASWTEGKRSTGIDVGGVKELQNTDEIGAVSLKREHKDINLDVSLKPKIYSSND